MRHSPSATRQTLPALIESLPACQGTYALLLHVASPLRLDIASHKEMPLPQGDYVYVGSACGPGGLRARVGRHLRGDGRPHWHIDRLRRLAPVYGVYYATTTVRLECAWSRAIAALPGIRIPIIGFGSSDCTSGCRAHLLALPASTKPAQLQTVITQSGDQSVVFIETTGGFSLFPSHHAPP
ncbi:MAG: GIY-YIG nuclease family protein [Chloroflexi bacterium]|nr:GIY-YIG nuclease family protein [Chloroflexota bacterium]